MDLSLDPNIHFMCDNVDLLFQYYLKQQRLKMEGLKFLKFKYDEGRNIYTK